MLEVWTNPNGNLIIQRYTEWWGQRIFSRGCYNGTWENWTVYGTRNITVSNLDAFKNWVRNSAPIGISIYNVNTGAQQCAIVQKVSSNYCSFIMFGYAANFIHYKCYNGTWTTA